MSESQGPQAKPPIDELPAQGLTIGSRWRIIRAETSAHELIPFSGKTIRLVEGRGWGKGAHPTTQLCLEAVFHFGKGAPRALDFGSGSGILSIALALQGAQVVGVEIESEANLTALKNAEANSVLVQTTFSELLPDADQKFSVIVANILRPVLLEFAHALAQRLEPGGALILSGLVSTDLPQIIARYSPLLGCEPEIFSKGEWRALVWPRVPS